MPTVALAYAGVHLSWQPATLFPGVHDLRFARGNRCASSSSKRSLAFFLEIWIKSHNFVPSPIKRVAAWRPILTMQRFDAVSRMEAKLHLGRTLRGVISLFRIKEDLSGM
jgi:hypothetical protein